MPTGHRDNADLASAIRDGLAIRTDDAIKAVPLNWRPGGGAVLQFGCGPGLHQFSVIVDAAGFDWDELYMELGEEFASSGVRTGPWDFSPNDNNKPLVPSYRVNVDGRRLGMWFFERVSLEDLAAQRFRGKFAFYVDREGEHELELTPYRQLPIHWLSARLEADPLDTLAPLPHGLRSSRRSPPLAAWRDPAFWEEHRCRLGQTHAMYREPLKRVFNWVHSRDDHDPDDILLLITSHHLDGRAGALDEAMQVVDQLIDLPHWGNPGEDAYGHDGDMRAMRALRTLAMTWHALGDELGDRRRRRLEEKLALQGERFFELALLNRDYWGGSILQDHGRKSMSGFGTAALYMLGVIPEAELWTRYAIGCIDRGINAMPRDGDVPPSSYCRPANYLEEPTNYRDTLLAMSGRDIFDDAPFREIVEFVCTVLREQDHLLLSTATSDDLRPFIGAGAFFNRIAAKYDDHKAAWLQRQFIDSPEIDFFHPAQTASYYAGLFWSFFAYEPSVEAAAPERGKSHLRHFRDSGVVHYRDVAQDVTLSLRCGPVNGYHAYRNTQCPCDQIDFMTGAGHFCLFLGGRQMLFTPDSGYRLHSFLRTCMLVDGAGQYGDIGYPMSIPSKLYRGESIEQVRWDPSSGRGLIRLDLAPAYPDELGMLSYTREFIMGREREIICRDCVAFDRPHRLSWLFQGKREAGVCIEEHLRSRFGQSPALWIEPQTVGVELTAGVHETEVVWSYCSAGGFKPFDHVRYDTIATTTTAAVDFHMRW